MKPRSPSVISAILRLSIAASIGMLGCQSGDVRHDLEEISEPEGLDGMSRQVRRQYDERRAALDRALADPDTTEAVLAESYGRLGDWFHAHRIFELARPSYRNATHLAPDEFRWPYLHGHVLKRRDERDAAAQQFRRALELQPDYLPIWVSLAEMELDAGELEAARGGFQRALELDPRCARALYGLGLIALDSGRPSEAVDFLERALAEQGSSNSVLYSLGMAHRRLGNDDQASSLLQRASIRENDERTSLEMQDPVMDQIRSLRQERSTLRVRAAEQLFENRRYAESVDTLRLALEESGDSGELRFLLGLALRALDQPEAAADEIRRSIALRPDYAPAHFQLGVLALADGSADEAKTQLRKALEIDPDYRAAHLRIGEILRREGDCDEATSSFERVLELEPSSAASRFGLAACHLLTDRPRAAYDTVAQGLVLDPDAPGLRHLMARLLATHPDADLRDGAKALEMSAPAPGAQTNYQQVETLAMALAELGRYSEAASWQRKVLEMVERGDKRPTRWIRERLTLFEKGKPVRQVWGDGEPQTLPPLAAERGRVQSVAGQPSNPEPGA